MWGLVMAVLAATTPADNRATVVPRLAEADWPKIDVVCGFHAVVHKRAKLAIRVIEFDGSASVAWDPVQLFIVATNEGTSDLRENVWRLPEGVDAVNKVLVTPCGVEILAEVDKIGDGEEVVGEIPLSFEACFIDASGGLQSDLRFSKKRSVSGPSSRRR